MIGKVMDIRGAIMVIDTSPNQVKTKSSIVITFAETVTL